MKSFNTSVVCNPAEHYMVDISGRVDRIIDRYITCGKYITMNRARQYGKTTMLYALARKLREQYYVIQLSFEWADSFFESEHALTCGFIDMAGREMELSDFPQGLIDQWKQPVDDGQSFLELDRRITQLCTQSDREVILMIDEVDRASNNRLMMLFLGLLRDKYIRQAEGRDHTFKSVILASVHDIRNLKAQIRSEDDHRFNSPWNVAVDIKEDFSFSAAEIAQMILEYKSDHGLAFDVTWFGERIYDYTCGYPYLVSRICQILDEEVAWQEPFDSLSAAWTPEGLQQAIHMIVNESNPLFDDLTKRLDENAELKKMVSSIVVYRKNISFHLYDNLVRLGVVFGWFKDDNGNVAISNRIFEVLICNKLLQEKVNTEIYQLADEEKQQLKSATGLNMDAIIDRFAAHYQTIYADRTADFLENEARMIFLTFLKPIINGVGNYYIESELVDKTRTDIVVDYHGHQYVIELKIWHGQSYQNAGKEQLVGYLTKYQLQKGWLISFCFNKNKEDLVGTSSEEYQGKVVRQTVV